jgi:predicted O-methyltransferase YrrM
MPPSQNSYVIEWLSADSFILNGTRFQLELEPSETARSTEPWPINKSRPYIEAYLDIRRSREIRDVIELGTLGGGSAIFLDVLFQPRRLVTVDVNRRPAKALEAWIRAHGNRSVVPAYGISQSDKDALRSIVRNEFRDGLDLIVDDASHLLGPSRDSFNTLFPYLRPGGLYLIEDWCWAHNPNFQGPDAPWADEPALTNLILEIVLRVGCNPGQTTAIDVSLPLVMVTRGPNQIDAMNFDVSSGVPSRGRSLGVL